MIIHKVLISHYLWFPYMLCILGTCVLTLKVPITTAADDNFFIFFIFFFFIFFFFRETILDISCELSAKADDSHEMLRLLFSEK